MFCAMDHGFDFESFIFGPHRRRRRRSMKWKIFERGDLKFVILRLVSKRPMHGYEVMKALEEESKGYYRPSPGSVYPTLQMLEDEGYVTVEEQEGKKIYTITDEGVAYLGENEDVVDEVFDRVRALHGPLLRWRHARTFALVFEARSAHVRSGVPVGRRTGRPRPDE